MAALIIAHRGGAPELGENTAAAFELAVASGADMLETDVLCTSDGHLVARHDQLVTLTNGERRRVHEMPLDLIRQTVPSIMLFDEFVERFCTTMPVNIDVKAPGFEAALVKLLRKHDVMESMLVSSRDATSLRKIKLLAPEVGIGLSRGQIVSWLGREPHATIAARVLRPTLPVQLLAHAQLALADAFMLNYRLIQPWLVDFFHGRGYRVFAWTVNDLPTAQWLDDIGVDGIATDYPAPVVEVRTRREP